MCVIACEDVTTLILLSVSSSMREQFVEQLDREMDMNENRVGTGGIRDFLGGGGVGVKGTWEINT